MFQQKHQVAGISSRYDLREPSDIKVIVAGAKLGL